MWPAARVRIDDGVPHLLMPGWDAGSDARVPQIEGRDVRQPDNSQLSTLHTAGSDGREVCTES